MPKEYKILHVEDSVTEADLIKRLLASSEMKFTYFHAKDKNSYLCGLAEFIPEIILCDHTLPGFNSIEAYEIYQGRNLDIPFILVTGTVSEEFAVEMMKRGIDDYLLKSNLHRLPSAIENSFEKRNNQKKINGYHRDLKFSESNIRTIIESSDLGLILLDESATILHINTNANNFAKLVWKQALKKGQNIIPLLPKNKSEDFIERFQKALKGEKSTYEFQYLLNDNSEIILKLNFTPVINSAGKTERVSVSLEDITERKKAEEILIQLSQAVEQSSASVIITDIKGDIQYVNKKFTETTGYTKDEAIGNNPRMLKSGYTSDSEYKKLWEKISAGKEWRGELHNKRKNGEFFWESASISPVMNADGTIINFLAIKEDITERKSAEEALEKEQYLMQILMNTVPDHIYFKDSQSRFLRINKAQAKLFGLTDAAEALGKTDFDFFSREHATQTFEDEQAIMRTGQIMQKEEKETWPDKSTTYVLTTKMPLRNSEGNITGTFGISRDITERKIAEETIKASEEKYKDLIDNISELICTHDLDGNVLSMNKAAEKMLGFTFDSQANINIEGLLTAEQKDNFASYLKRIQEKGHLQETMKVHLSNGDVRIWEFNNSLKKTGSNGPVIRGYARDITQQKKAEKEVLKTKEQFQNLVESISGTYWVTDLTINRTIYVSPSYELVSGRKSSDLYKNQVNFLNAIHPLDREQVISIYINIGKKDKLNYSYRIIKPDGEIRWISAKSSILIDRNGHKMEYGYAEDITERQKAETEIMDKNLQLRSLSNHLQNIREEERTLIAREIHDELGQQLTVMKMDISWVQNKINRNDHVILSRMEELKNMADQTIQSVRRIAFELRPSMLDDLGINATIDWYAREFEKRTDIKIVLSAEKDEKGLQGTAATNIYRVFQECLTNIARHSGATLVEVQINQNKQNFSMTITDNGKGFDAAQVQKGKTLGIVGMKERAALINSSIEITSVPGKGTIIKIEVPLNIPGGKHL